MKPVLNRSGVVVNAFPLESKLECRTSRGTRPWIRYPLFARYRSATSGHRLIGGAGCAMTFCWKRELAS